MRDYKLPKNNLGADRLTLMNLSPARGFTFNFNDMLSLTVYQEQEEPKLYFAVEITHTTIKIYKNGLIYKTLDIILE